MIGIHNEVPGDASMLKESIIFLGLTSADNYLARDITNYLNRYNEYQKDQKFLKLGRNIKTELCMVFKDADRDIMISSDGETTTVNVKDLTRFERIGRVLKVC